VFACARRCLRPPTLHKNRYRERTVRPRPLLASAVEGTCSPLSAQGRVEGEGIFRGVDRPPKEGEVFAREQETGRGLVCTRGAASTPRNPQGGAGEGASSPWKPSERSLLVRPHQPARPPPRYDLDMAGLEDEQLVVLVQECGYVPARDELISRCIGLKDRFIHRQAARSRLQEADRLDAQQDAVLWILEAIREYNTGQQVVPRGCRFRTFLYRVLLSRFIDLLRRKRRRQARLRLGGYMFGSPGAPPSPP